MANLHPKPDAALKHAATTAAARQGELPTGFEHLQPIVDEYWNGWIADLGGEENISAMKRGVLFSARVCLVVALLALEHLRRTGFEDKHGRPQPVLGILATYLNSLRLNLVAVGLERRARDVTPSLEAYLRQKETVGE